MIPNTCKVSPDASTLSEGLVSWWRAEGNANDSVGPNNGALQNGVTFVTGPMGGQAFAFNGTTADVLIPTSTTLNVGTAFSLAFWIYVPSLPAQETNLISKYETQVENKTIALNANGTLAFYLAGWGGFGGSVLPGATPLTPGSWHHVVGTYDGTAGVANIYIDGTFDASQAAAGDVYDGVGSLAFAHNAAATGTTEFLDGYLAEIRWYSRGLSGAEVGQLFSGCN